MKSSDETANNGRGRWMSTEITEITEIRGPAIIL